MIKRKILVPRISHDAIRRAVPLQCMLHVLQITDGVQ
jgi:hypothetical protein